MVDKREEAIRKRAYDIWDQEGRPHGRDCERAEAQIDAIRIYAVTNDGKILRSYQVDPAILGRRRWCGQGPPG
jgi:DUF2934 family protein